jgi:hypothetical protein
VEQSAGRRPEHDEVMDVDEEVEVPDSHRQRRVLRPRPNDGPSEKSLGKRKEAPDLYAAPSKKMKRGKIAVQLGTENYAVDELFVSKGTSFHLFTFTEKPRWRKGSRWI